MHLKALDIDIKLGRVEGMANDYGNLGLVYQAQGDLNRAEQMLHKTLEINERLGRVEGIAIVYANLGNIMQVRGDRTKARAAWLRSLDLFTGLGSDHMVKKIQHSLDELSNSEESNSTLERLQSDERE